MLVEGNGGDGGGGGLRGIRRYFYLIRQGGGGTKLEGEGSQALMARALRKNFFFGFPHIYLFGEPATEGAELIWGFNEFNTPLQYSKELLNG